VENGKPIIIGDHDPRLSTWVAEVCPVDLLKYYCVHGHYVGCKNCFPCPVCKGRPRYSPRLRDGLEKKKGRPRRPKHGRMAQR
jgi:hypothetical protein